MAKDEIELSNFQTLQRGNNCAFHTISSAIKILFNVQINPQKLAKEIDSLWWRLKPMRIFPGWAVTPKQMIKVISHLQKKTSLPLTAKYLRGSIELLKNELSKKTSVPIVTITWFRNQNPAIYLGYSPFNFNPEKSANAHTMILAAFDPEHFIDGVGYTPWGFINSWTNPPAHLFWMTDLDFQNSWNSWFPFVRTNSLILIKKSLKDQ